MQRVNLRILPLKLPRDFSASNPKISVTASFGPSNSYGLKCTGPVKTSRRSCLFSTYHFYFSHYYNTNAYTSQKLFNSITPSPGNQSYFQLILTWMFFQEKHHIALYSALKMIRLKIHLHQPTERWKQQKLSPAIDNRISPDIQSTQAHKHPLSNAIFPPKRKQMKENRQSKGFSLSHQR